MNIYKIYEDVGKFQAFLVDYHCPLFRVLLNTPRDTWELPKDWEEEAVQ